MSVSKLAHSKSVPIGSCSPIDALCFLELFIQSASFSVSHFGFSTFLLYFFPKGHTFLKFCSYFLCKVFDTTIIFFNSHLYNIFCRLNNIVDPLILYVSTPISSVYILEIKSYTAQMTPGVAYSSVHAHALTLPLNHHIPTTQNFRNGHKPSI